MKLFRAMICDEDGSPTIGRVRDMLGVRPKERGMSVGVGNPANVRYTVRPLAFNGPCLHTTMFNIEESALHPKETTKLVLGHVNASSHGEIERAEDIAEDAFQSCLAKTRPSWSQTPHPIGAVPLASAVTLPPPATSIKRS